MQPLAQDVVQQSIYREMHRAAVEHHRKLRAKAAGPSCIIEEVDDDDDDDGEGDDMDKGGGGVATGDEVSPMDVGGVDETENPGCQLGGREVNTELMEE